MRVICRTVRALALLAAFNGMIYMNPRGALAHVFFILCGFLLVFPVNRLRKLYLFVRDKRPQPRVWSTVVLADPRDGYPEGDDWRLIGVVQERR